MNTELRELTNADIEAVAGGGKVAGYKYCPMGTVNTPGTSGGLVPTYVDCAVPFSAVLDAFLQGFEKGKGGSGQPA
jgi:hypothetical protein